MPGLMTGTSGHPFSRDMSTIPVSDKAKRVLRHHCGHGTYRHANLVCFLGAGIPGSLQGVSPLRNLLLCMPGKQLACPEGRGLL